jgi:uncharacterized membrane protein
MVIAFDHPDFKGEIVQEIVNLSDAGVVRLLDALVVSKNADGVETIVQSTELSEMEMTDLGVTLGALIGLGIDGESGAEAGAVVGAAATEDGHILDDMDIVDVLEEIEPDTTAAILLLEHTWAIPLRDAIVNANGVPVVDMWIHPLELVAMGAAIADE